MEWYWGAIVLVFLVSGWAMLFWTGEIEDVLAWLVLIVLLTGAVLLYLDAAVDATRVVDEFGPLW